jgi:GT2 family glycosyltransferase
VTIRNVLAVTGACLLTRRAAYEEVGRMDEGYVLTYSDIDLCLKLWQRGYRNVWTPYAELYHHESLTRGTNDSPSKRFRMQHEWLRFRAKWRHVLGGVDPYGHVNLTPGGIG